MCVVVCVCVGGGGGAAIRECWAEDGMGRIRAVRERWALVQRQQPLWQLGAAKQQADVASRPAHLQLKLLVAMVVGWKVPAAQTSQVALPLLKLYWPAGQRRQPVAW